MQGSHIMLLHKQAESGCGGNMRLPFELYKSPKRLQRFLITSSGPKALQQAAEGWLEAAAGVRLLASWAPAGASHTQRSCVSPRCPLRCGHPALTTSMITVLHDLGCMPMAAHHVVLC